MAGSYKDVVKRARSAYNGGRTLSVEHRRRQLQQLRQMCLDHKDTFLDALKIDLRKPQLEAMMLEVNAVIMDITYTLNRLDKWVKTEMVSSAIPFDRSYIYNDPYGVVLVMGAWNYPLQLALLPVTGALAAGNAVILKPSEVSPATASALAKLIPLYLDKECVQVVCGGVEETTQLLQERFDYIFYTGSATVGKIIREAANKFLTPTTLELGGKSPCYIDNSVDLNLAVRRVLWGKMQNLGQTCIAPDYLLCSKALQDPIIKKVKEVLREWYGHDPKDSPHLARIVAERHVERLASYLECGKVVVGGRFDLSDRWVEPTLLVDVPENSKVMTEEIFGPILPIINVETHVDAIKFINKREKPLALYVFSKKEAVKELFLRQVRCGGVTINDTLFHAASSTMPFGGVGNSGMGAYHGKYSFDTFTHKKSCLNRSYNPLIEKVTRARFPPYTEKNMKALISQKDPGDGPGVLHHLKVFTKYLFSMSIGALLLFLYIRYTYVKV
ncbi:aldehyde dehydrogenase, dimeric NADP-preferring-like [Homarus americanus]|uniref:aldehyde dehydrogenase, dimeric NADP-preferring-like n=1 Tax=Homarus americanus TaxID=6706 RepID=UPI001C4843DA|nr:aldehyde dehydrogenase, dimeric NADP-preferring-like [Homarus americanus]